MRNVWYINVYMTNRAYGGGEEGGWWYDTGEHIRTLGPFLGTPWVNGFAEQENPTRAQRRRARWMPRVNAIVERMNREDTTPDGMNRDLNSVNCAGRYQAFIEEHPGRDFPTERPHYE